MPILSGLFVVPTAEDAGTDAGTLRKPFGGTAYFAFDFGNCPELADVDSLLNTPTVTVPGQTATNITVEDGFRVSFLVGAWPVGRHVITCTAVEDTDSTTLSAVGYLDVY